MILKEMVRINSSKVYCKSVIFVKISIYTFRINSSKVYCKLLTRITTLTLTYVLIVAKCIVNFT